MSPRGVAAGSHLLIAADWGQALWWPGVDALQARLVHEIALGEGDPSVALALADAWQRTRHPALLPVLAVALAVRTGGQARVLRIERPLPRGNHLGELIPRVRVQSGPMLAALWSDAIAGVLHAHGAGLTVGPIAPEQLFVAPPGQERVAAVAVHAPGHMPIAHAARGALPPPESPAFAQLVPCIEVAAPEVLAGQAPTPASDAYTVCALVAWSLLRHHMHAGPTLALVRHAAGRGPLAPDLEHLDETVPTLAAVVARGMAPMPWARAGALTDLHAVLQRELAGRPTAVVDGVTLAAPWVVGSPLVPLAAFSGATAYEDRFAEGLAEHGVAGGHRFSSSRVLGLDRTSGPIAAPKTDAVRAPAELDPRVRSALERLDAERELNRRAAEDRGRNLLSRLVLLVVVTLIALAIAAVGIHHTDRVERNLREVERIRHPPAPRPVPPRPQPRVLMEPQP
jgi:hypothetical protein